MSAALDLLGGLVLEDGRRWGEAAYQWQWADARAILVDRQRLAYLTRPRGAAKTQDAAGFALAAMLAQLPPSARSYCVAADRDQGALLVDSLAGFVTRTPEVGGAVRVDAWKATATRTGASIEVLAADAPSAFGLRPHLIVADEFAQWGTTPGPRRLWAALFSALPKVPGSRLVVLTSAGDPAHPAGKLIRRARGDPAWYVSEVPGPCPWVSLEDLAQQRAELPESLFARLHLNQWYAAEDRLVRPEDLAACVTLDGPQEPRPGVVYRIGVDLGLRHDRTAIAVAHAELVPERTPPARRVVLDRLIVLAGSRRREVSLSVVEEHIAEASRAYGRARVFLDPWQAIGLAQRLRARGLSVEEYPFSATSVARLASTLHLLLRDRLLALPDDPSLLDELANVRLRETSPGVLRIDHDADKYDDQAISLALAAHTLVSRPAPGKAVRSAPQIMAARIDPVLGYTSYADRRRVELGRTF